VNTQIRRVFAVMMVMFVALMVSVTSIQFFRAGSLNADGRNVRTLYREYGRDRGPIVVAGDAVAVSTPVDDDFGYLREYPEGELLAPVTGYFSLVNGITGIEDAENAVLNGTSSSLLLERTQALFTGRQPAGGSVELTIDPAAQRAGYEAFGEQVGGAVALDPTTGAVLALISRPSFDPNLLASHDTAAVADEFERLNADEGRPLDNRAIASRLYPPGSTMKLITSAALLAEGYTPDSQVPAPDSFQLPGSGSLLRNPAGERCGGGDTVTLEFALQISCNTPFAILGAEIGDDALRAQAEAFGFGRDLDIPLTVTPSIFPDDPDAAQTAMSAIGQFDVRATPLQMAMVSAAVANRGELMRPYLVATTRGPNLDLLDETEPDVFSTAMTETNAAYLRDMMINVVENGTGTRAQIPGVTVAGKTGTAQTAEGLPPHAWFTAFAPAEDPQVAVAVAVEYGGTLGDDATGSRVAAPIAKAIMEAVLSQ
jgi:peptidoglycan glycosyltransferase